MKYFALALLLPILASNSPGEELPRDAKELIAKLSKFEKEENAKAARNIQEKRVSVIKVLDTILKRETQNGNLEMAIAIKHKIQSLKNTSPSPQLNQAISKAEKFRNSLQTLIFVRSSGEEYSFRIEEMLHKTTHGKVNRFTPVFDEKDRAISWLGRKTTGDQRTIKLDSRLKKAVYYNSVGARPEDMEVKSSSEK